MKFSVLAEFNSRGADGGKQSGGKMAGIEGMLGEAVDSAVTAVLQSGVGVEGDCDAGEFLDACEEGGVKLRAELRERSAARMGCEDHARLACLRPRWRRGQELYRVRGPGLGLRVH